MGEPALVRMNMRDREALKKWVAERLSRGQRLSANLLRTIYENDDLFELSTEARPGQFGARVLLSAVHYLLLNDPTEELAAYYPTITPDPLPADDMASTLLAFCRKHRPALLQMTRLRTLQTTFVERAVQVLYAMNVVANCLRQPFSIIEVGSSAGLLLLFDHYRYEFGGGRHVGRDDAQVVVSNFEFLDPQPPVPASIPQIVGRIGLDLEPIDVRDEDARTWALACISPDRVAQFNNLRAALEYRARTPLEVIAGDALKTLPLALERLDGPVCVFHSRCLYQWPVEMQTSFAAMVATQSRHRVIHRIGIERSNLRHISDEVTGGGMNEICHTVYDGGESKMHLLGRVGEKIEWLA